MMAVTPWRAMVCATSSRSPVEPATNGTLPRHQEAKAGRQIVEHDHRLAGVDQLVHHVAADIAGPARDQDRHDPIPIFMTVLPSRP